jgi:hypothetical protein
LSLLVISRWNKAITAPSNSAPLPLLIVVGLKAFQIMLSLQSQQKIKDDNIKDQSMLKIKMKIKIVADQMLVAMKREIPEPRPYPFWRSSSRHITIIPAKQS